MTLIRRPYETNAEIKTVNKAATVFDPEASMASRANIDLWFTVYMRVEYGVCCWCVIQEEWQDIPVADYKKNLSTVEAYNDPQLQPVVVMKKLDESRSLLLLLLLLVFIPSVTTMIRDSE